MMKVLHLSPWIGAALLFVFFFQCRQEACHAKRTFQRTTLLSSAAVSGERASRPKLKLKKAIELSMERKNSWKNSGGMTCVHAAQDAGFKRCCLRTGKYDGGNRNYFSRK